MKGYEDAPTDNKPEWRRPMPVRWWPAIAVLAPLLRPGLALRYSDIRPLLIEGGPAGKRVSPPATKQRIIADLKQIEQQASDLRMTLENLHRSTAKSFRNLNRVRLTLHILEVIAKGAEAEVPDEPPALPKETTPPRRLALTAAYVFIETTGQKPTIINKAEQPAGGPFLEFLDAVFAARGVNASREDCAKFAIRAINATKRGP
jgi:hypothetical protein